MRKLSRIIKTGVVIAIAAFATGANAQSVINTHFGQQVGADHMRVYGRTSTPIGHVMFCRDNQEACSRQGDQAQNMHMSDQAWRDLHEVNHWVNSNIHPISDIDMYQTIERWTFPPGAGDCEDYVLLKRRMLLNRGWPSSALLITVVRDDRGEGHAVLTASTDAGDFILDNRFSAVLRWHDTPYSYRKRQSAKNPKIWLSLTPSEQSSSRATAGRDTVLR